MKTTIEVNGEVIEIDLDNLTEEEAKKFNINFDIPKEEDLKGSGWVITTHKIKSKFLRILFFLSLMAFFLCGFLIEDGWTPKTYFKIKLKNVKIEVMNNKPELICYTLDRFYAIFKKLN